MADAVQEVLEGVGEMWGDQIVKPDPVLKYNTIPWTILKFTFGLIILTTVYLLYSLKELPWTLFGSVLGMSIWCIAPFFVGFSIGLSMENIKKAFALSFALGLISVVLVYLLFNLPYSMNLFEYGPAYGIHLWWSVLLSFINMISFLPIGALVSASMNIYE